MRKLVYYIALSIDGYEIDRLVVKKYPVVAGAGRTAFGSRFSPTNFNLDDVQTFPGGNAVLSHSRVH